MDTIIVCGRPEIVWVAPELGAYPIHRPKIDRIHGKYFVCALIADRNSIFDIACESETPELSEDSLQLSEVGVQGRYQVLRLALIELARQSTNRLAEAGIHDTNMTG